MNDISRQPAGQPTGGQFAPTTGADAGLDLAVEPARVASVTTAHVPAADVKFPVYFNEGPLPSWPKELSAPVVETVMQDELLGPSVSVTGQTKDGREVSIYGHIDSDREFSSSWDWEDDDSTNALSNDALTQVYGYAEEVTKRITYRYEVAVAQVMRPSVLSGITSLVAGPPPAKMGVWPAGTSVVDRDVVSTAQRALNSHRHGHPLDSMEASALVMQYGDSRMVDDFTTGRTFDTDDLQAAIKNRLAAFDRGLRSDSPTYQREARRAMAALSAWASDPRGEDVE